MEHSRRSGVTFAFRLSTFALLLAAAATAFAQAFPTRPIRMIAPFPPGGGTDLLSRLLAVPLAQTFGQPIIVDNSSMQELNLPAEFQRRHIRRLSELSEFIEEARYRIREQRRGARPS